MRRPLVVLLALVSLGCLAGAVQALGVASLPLAAPGARPAAEGSGPDAGGAPVRAGRVVVDTAADRPDADPGDGSCGDRTGRCTLRAAVMEANANEELRQVVLPRRTYRLRIAGAGEDRARRGDLDVRRSLTVVGRGATIGGGGRDRLFDVAADVRLALSGLRLTGGAPPAGESGGAIRSAGRLTLTGVKVVRNAVSGENAAGGGIFSAGGTVLLRTSQANRNVAPGGGGAIAADGGSVLLRDSRLIANQAAAGGALRIAVDASADLRDSALERNRATGAGGGAIHLAGGRLTALRGSLSGNEAAGAGSGGALRNDGGRAILDGTELRSNGAAASGGGVAAAGGETTLAHVQLNDNAAADGGGLDLVSGARATVRNAVVQGNRVAGSGGAFRLAAGTALAVTEGSYVIVNRAAGAGRQEGGGAISNGGGRATVAGGVVAGNVAGHGFGGAVHNRGGSTTIGDADLSSNVAAVAGGAIAAAAGSVAVTDCVTWQNRAGRRPLAWAAPGARTTVDGRPVGR